MLLSDGVAFQFTYARLQVFHISVACTEWCSLGLGRKGCCFALAKLLYSFPVGVGIGTLCCGATYLKCLMCVSRPTQWPA